MTLLRRGSEYVERIRSNCSSVLRLITPRLPRHLLGDDVLNEMVDEEFNEAAIDPAVDCHLNKKSNHNEFQNYVLQQR